MSSWHLPCETTDEIIVGASQPNEEQYPGLPPTSEKPYIFTAITDGIPSMDLFKRLDSLFGDQNRVIVYTLDEVLSFRHWLPSVYHRIAGTFDYLGLPDSSDPRARMLQIQSEMVARISTIDAGIIHGRRDLETVVAKVRQYCRIGRLLASCGLDAEVDAAALGPYTEDRLDDILIATKRGLLDLYERVDWPLAEVPTTRLEPNLTPAEREKYGFIPDLERLLGENWVAGFAYGSSARTDDEDKFDDYDTTLLLHDQPAVYPALRGLRPHWRASDRRFLDGAATDVAVLARALELSGGIPLEELPEERRKEVLESALPAGGKHLSINTFPAGGSMFRKYVRSLDDATEFRENIRMLRGPLDFPILTLLEEDEHGSSHGGVKNKILADSTGRYVREPERLVGKPNLFDFLVKNLRFIFKHAMKMETGRTLPKDELERELRVRHGIRIPKYKPNAAHLRDAVLHARVCSAFLWSEYLKDREFKGTYFTGDTPTLRSRA